MARKYNSEINIPIKIDESILFCDEDSENSSHVVNDIVSSSASLPNIAAGNTKEKDTVEKLPGVC